MTNHKYEPIMGLDICMVCKTIESNPIHSPISKPEPMVSRDTIVASIQANQSNTSQQSDVESCECCDNIGSLSNKTLVVFKTMKMCQECYHKEISLTNASQTPEAQENRVREMHETMDANRILTQSVKIDSGIQTRSDIFNAETVAINDLAKAIATDDSITNKPYKLAEMLRARFEHLRSVVFQLNEQLNEVGNQQKAIQVYLNTMANTLRAEEREKLKIADINYKPQPIKSLSVGTGSSGPRKVKVSKVLDKKQLATAAKELGVSEFMVQMLVVSKGITIEAATKLIRASLDSATTQQTTQQNKES